MFITTVPDTDELAHFREKWKQEIRGRARQPLEQTQSSRQSQSVANEPALSDVASLSSLRPRLQSALEVYVLAISREQSGDHPEATRLYRNAFRLDPNVDTAYYREELARNHQPEVQSDLFVPVVLPRQSSAGHPIPSPSKITVIGGTLTTLFSSWPKPLSFAPLNESHSVPIDKLPDELVVSILCSLAHSADASTIERFGAVSRRARILTLDSTIWRKLVQLTVVPPQLANRNTPVGELAVLYRSDYRRVYVEHPRLRFDGVYISICHYVRSGLGENPWITTSHLITYRRFLRFLSNGDVLSYRGNEDQDIGDVVRALQPGLRRRDMCVGKWRLTGTTVLVTNLADRTTGGVGGNTYSFQMSLTLKSRPSLGRWNRLDLFGYESVNPDTGEKLSLPLRHERPLWFSKVGSY